MGNICSCLNTERPKHIISVIGLEDDIKSILVHIVPEFSKEKQLTKFSEHIFDHGNIEVIIHAHIITPMIKSLIKLHSAVESAIIYSIDTDSKESIEAVKILIEDNDSRSKSDMVTVLCRGKYLDNPELEVVKQMFKSNVHNHFELVKFNEEETEIYSKRAFEKIYGKLSGN